MIERIAADGIMLLHFAFILFVGLGGLFCLRWKRAAWLHLPAAIWGAVIEFSGGICPLTPLEQRLRMAAGRGGYAGSFVEHYLLPLIYPAALDEFLRLMLGVAVILINLIVYGWVWFRSVRRRSGMAEDARP